MTADIPSLLSHPSRRAVAHAALDAPRTVGEIADVLHTKDGAIRTVVQRLAREGLLNKSERPGRRSGTVAAAYQVKSMHAAAVRDSRRDVGEPTLEQNAEVLLVPLSGLPDAAAVLARERPSVIAWAVRTRDPQLSLMLGLRNDSAPDERDALLITLRHAGVDCARLHLGEIFAPSTLFEYAGSLTGHWLRSLPHGN